ncbi:hypothetical protein MMC14_008366 [Varicellaria rhodocarpa]|nr:hypothetical protein [Varicellaria rhodocarpa]
MLCQHSKSAQTSHVYLAAAAAAAHRVDLPGSRAEAQPAATPSTAPQSQSADTARPEPSHGSATGTGWRSTHAADLTANSPRATWAGFTNAEGVREAERAAGEGPDSRPDGFPVMQALLCEERMDFQHVFEDSAPGMPWARVSFQVSLHLHLRLNCQTDTCLSVHLARRASSIVE